MNLEEKLAMYRHIHAKDPGLPSVTYEAILEKITEDYNKTMSYAKNSGIKIQKAGVPFPDGVQAVVLNTDVLARLGHVISDPVNVDDETKKMIYYISKGVLVGAVVSAIFLEVLEGKELGDNDTYTFMTKFCVLSDNGHQLEETARLTLNYMTK